MDQVLTPQNILLVLPLAYQDGRDKYAGFLRYVSERHPKWSILLERERITPLRARQLLKERIHAVVLDGMADSTICRILSHVPFCVVLDTPDRNVFHADSTSVAFAEIDSASLGQRAGAFFLSRPNTIDLAFIGYDAVSWSIQRQTTFHDTLLQTNRLTRELTIPYQNEQNATSRRNLVRFLRGLEKPAGIFAACDRLARWIIQVAGEEKLSVPNEISVLGVDNEDIICTHARPTLSSLQPDFTALGHEAARLLDQMLTTGNVPLSGSRVGGIRLVERESTAPAYSAAFLVAQVKETIQHWPNRNPHIDEIAGKLGVSRRLLDLRFREITGETILDFIRHEKVEKAKRLLAETDMPIGTICEACDFRSVNHLKRIFRSTTGQSMKDWRKSCLNGDRGDSAARHPS